MAEHKHIHGKTRTWDERPWGNLEDLVKSNFSSGDDAKEELKCTCGPGLSNTQQLLISHKPAKSVRKKRHATSKAKVSGKNGKTFSKSAVQNSSGSSEASVYPTLCDRPRNVDKSYKKVSKVRHPDVTRVKSIEITERVKKNCCSGIKRRNVLRSKISRTNLLRSPSTAGYCESNSSDDTEVKIKGKSNRAKTKFKVNQNAETEKDNLVRDLHRNKNKFKVKKRIEKIRDCQDKGGGEDREVLFEKSRFGKSKSRESLRESLSGKSRSKIKVYLDNNRRFKNSGRQSGDCCCFYNYSDECAREDKNYRPKNRYSGTKFKYDDKKLEYNRENLEAKTLSDSSCDCLTESDKKDSKLPGNWNKCEKYLKKISQEYRSLSSHLQSMQEEMEKSPNVELAYKLKSSRRYLNTDYPCEDEAEYNVGEGKVSDDEDTIKALTSLCETFKTMSREIDPAEDNKQQSCKTEYCNCNIGAEDGIKEGFGEPSHLKKRRKKKVRLHEFAFPKIVKSEKSNGRGDVRKMFVYAPEGDDKSSSAPLTLHRTCSFVNCNIKSNNDEGYKYHLTYVQKYVSPTWKPNQSGDQNYLDSSSDYG